jgi:hypothetical protein
MGKINEDGKGEIEREGNLISRIQKKEVYG